MSIQDPYVRMIDTKTRSNQNLTKICFALVLALVCQQFFVMSKEKVVRVFIPATFSTTGGIVTSDTPDAANVYGFTSYIIQYINGWSRNAEDDYKQNINDVSFYTSNTFRQYLLSDYERRRNNNGINELNNRTRSLSTSSDYPYSANQVVAVSDTQWNVTLYLILTEHIGKRQIKKDVMRYVFEVIYRDDNPERNEWGLRITRLIDSERVR